MTNEDAVPPAGSAVRFALRAGIVSFVGLIVLAIYAVAHRETVSSAIMASVPATSDGKPTGAEVLDRASTTAAAAPAGVALASVILGLLLTGLLVGVVRGHSNAARRIALAFVLFIVVFLLVARDLIFGYGGELSGSWFADEPVVIMVMAALSGAALLHPSARTWCLLL